MKDAFAALGFERRPILDCAEIQERYLRQAALLHPDSAGGDALAFAELGTARALLENPAERLYHLIQLQGGENAVSGDHSAFSLPNEAHKMMDLAALLLEAHDRVSKLQNSLTPLARAVLIQPGRQCLLRLERAEKDIQLILNSLDKEIRIADGDWPNTSLVKLARIATTFRFVQKRETQISESLFQLRNALPVRSGTGLS